MHIVGYTMAAKASKVNCSIQGCPGEYEERSTLQTVRREGQVIVIDHVPADVCTVCGDTLLHPGTVRKIETLLQQERQPAGRVPLYEFA